MRKLAVNDVDGGLSVAWLDEDEEDDDSPCEPPDWEELEDDDEFDPEPVDDEVWDGFDPGEEPDEEEPPEELWNDGHWE